MAGPILFYFDFLSPYGYLGSVAVERVASKHGRSVVWRPLLLGISVLKVMGLKAVPDTPLKRDYVRHDLPRFARLLGLPFKPVGTPMRSLPAMRAFAWLDGQDPALARAFGRAVFRAQWAEGIDMSSPAVLAHVAAPLGIDPASLLAATDDPAVKATGVTQLRNEVPCPSP